MEQNHNFIDWLHRRWLLVGLISVAFSLSFLSACAQATESSPTVIVTQTSVSKTTAARIQILPTWTPSPTSPPQPTRTPRPTSTSVPMVGGVVATLPSMLNKGLLIDRPTYATLDDPVNLITLEYDPSLWMLKTYYPLELMGYALTHRSIYDCRLEPSVGQDIEGYQVEEYSRPLGSTIYEITRVSQIGDLKYANYCVGDGEDRTCYQLIPGDDHEACQQAAEIILATYQIISNPFIAPILTSPNNWLCQNEAGEDNLCQISYSVPLNALTYTDNDEGWTAGDDGLIYHLSGRSWSEVTSPTNQPIYDLSFSSPTDGWAVGNGTQVLRWDGKAWIQILPYHAPGEGPGGSTQMLYAVDASSDGEAWMVGYIKDLDGNTRPYALHWDGVELIEETDFPDCACGLNAVLRLGANDVIAVGGSTLGAIAFRWDGSAWTSNLIPGADDLYTLRLSADGTVWSAGIEYARDQSDTRGALFYFDGMNWQRVALPPVTGGIYQIVVLPSGQLVLGGDFTVLWSGKEWQPIVTGLAGYGWIVDIEVDVRGNVWALTRSGNLFRLEIGP